MSQVNSPELVIPIDWKAIRQRLKEAREPLSQAKFAKLLGFSQSEVSEWERGPRRPSSEYVSALSREIGISLDWLFWGLAPKYVSGKKGELNNQLEDLKGLLENTLSRVGGRELPGISIVSAREFPGGLKAAEFYALPLLSDAIAAGKPREVQDGVTEGVAIVHRAWCPNPKDSVFIRVKGDSMAPTIPDGALVVIDAAVKDIEQLLGHPVAIALDDSESTIKRLARNSARQLVGMPDNPSPDNQPVNIREGVRIVGLVRSVHAEVK